MEGRHSQPSRRTNSHDGFKEDWRCEDGAEFVSEFESVLGATGVKGGIEEGRAASVPRQTACAVMSETAISCD